MSLRHVLVVDDHQVVAEGIVRLLGDKFTVEAINDGRLVLDAVHRLLPDLVILDISMPNISGLEVIRELKRDGLDIKIIVLTMHADPNLAVAALSAGASGFVLKEASWEELLTAVNLVLEGGTYLAAGLTREIMTAMVSGTDPEHVELTTEQREVLRLIVSGQRAKEIADTLNLSTRSVEAIKYKTMRMLNVNSTAELVRYAVEHRLVPF